MQQRPTFIINNKQLVRAAGVVFYNIKDGQVEVFFRNKGDFGGKCNAEDSNPKQTAIREVCEESNGYFVSKWLHQQIDIRKYLYLYKAKYVLYFVKIGNINEKDINDYFGTVEKFSGKEHLCEWITLGQKTTGLHKRLPSSKVLLNKILEFNNLK
ncbi:hypothetical protein SS50377_25029 [Spironucleus salmonicida]|uniref:Nudix hydrolase domain-containing protein n=1 Tax=Spironucleus salmonicida TaxID=348837 RepID=V6LF09_9EUKA|nr:hypothetical protein SS50377_25029 [Spironucleus salmonicida]|eukprot:EST43082.1 Hypothetical protein SS50377_ee030 [Spironucleus salmonicida]